MLDETYRACLEAKRGGARIDRRLAGLVRDVRAAYGVTPLWVHGSVGLGRGGVPRPCLEVALETWQDSLAVRPTFGEDPWLGPVREPTKEIARMLLERYPRRRLRRIFPLPDDAACDWSRDLWVRISVFEEWVLEHGIRLTAQDTAEFERSLGLGDALWGTTRIAQTVVVLVRTEEQARTLRASGVTAEWARAYLELARRHDEFGYLRPGWVVVEVDSKEKFDREWRGDWLGYMK